MQLAAADALFQQGQEFRRRGEVQLALQAFSQALQAYRRLRRPDRESAALSHIAAVQHAHGSLRDARATLLEGLERARAAGQARREAELLGQLGVVLVELGEVDDAEQAHQRALTLYQVAGAEAGAASQLANLARLWAEKGDAARALAGWQQARDTFGRLGLRRETANTENGIAWLLRKE